MINHYLVQYQETEAFPNFLSSSCVKPSESLVDEPVLQQHFTNESKDTQDEAYGV